MIRFKHRGNFNHAEDFLKKNSKKTYIEVLKKYGEIGVIALASSTPRDSGETASSWGYEIVDKDGKTTIYWTNSHLNKGVNIAIILQYGHGTGTGGYVKGIDYINPAIRPIFDKMADDAWKEVTST